jgi:hypothetical protein
MMFGTPMQLRNSRLEELAHTVQLPCVNSELLINASALEWFTLLAKRKCMKYPFNLYQPSTGNPRATQLASERTGNLPVWIRAPKRGNEFYSGCSRAKLYEWAGKGFIRSVSIREPGQIKGVRLFHLASVLGFIEGCEMAVTQETNRQPL